METQHARLLVGPRDAAARDVPSPAPGAADLLAFGEEALAALQLLLGLLSRRDVAIDDEHRVVLALQRDALRRDQRVEAGAVLAAAHDLGLHFPSREHIGVAREIRGRHAVGHDEAAQALAHRLLGRIAEHPRELLVDAQDLRMADVGEDERVGREVEELVQLRLVPLQLFLRPRALEGVAIHFLHLEAQRPAREPAQGRAHQQDEGDRRDETGPEEIHQRLEAHALAPHQQVIAAGKLGVRSDHAKRRPVSVDHEPVGSRGFGDFGGPRGQVTGQRRLARVGEDHDLVVAQRRETRRDRRGGALRAGALECVEHLLLVRAEDVGPERRHVHAPDIPERNGEQRQDQYAQRDVREREPRRREAKHRGHGDRPAGLLREYSPPRPSHYGRRRTPCGN